jgi:uncharacterized protein YbbC (DUF1343 family)
MNRASVDHQLRWSCDVLNECFPGQLKALFTPQHGLWGDAQANMVETADGWHSRLGIPVYSLYSQTRRPTPPMLDDLDCLIVDLQDVGTRVYTFVWTVLECMRACATQGVGMLILDRPNPLGGQIIEGPLLQPEFKSFVGGASIPMRHGLTLGELAVLLRREQQLDLELNVLPMRAWQPEMRFEQLHRPWLFPSPNLPSLQSVGVYPGQVLLEGTNLSEGRGTTTPFELCGAPYVDGESLADSLASQNLSGVRFLPASFRPSFDKWQGEACGGVSIHVTDPLSFRPFRTSIELLRVVQRDHAEHFRWLDPPYEYETIKPPIDIIFGSDALRSEIATIDSSISLDARTWGERTLDCQLYGKSESRFRR